MRKESVGIVAVILAIIVVIAIIILGPWPRGYNPYYNPQESLPHIAAPTEIPGEYVNDTIVGNLSMSVSGSFYTIIPHNSPATFEFTIDIFVNNTGVTSVSDFHVVKVTVFNENATPIYTFGVVPDSNFTIAGSSTWTNEYQSDRDMVEIPADFLWAQYAFARVLLTYYGNAGLVLTTPLTEFWHAIE
ncbi:MAG: hypothetical protein ACFFEK_08340 [Candidatus Thorarchaeota archaeon]